VSWQLCAASIQKSTHRKVQEEEEGGKGRQTDDVNSSFRTRTRTLRVSVSFLTLSRSLSLSRRSSAPLLWTVLVFSCASGKSRRQSSVFLQWLRASAIFSVWCVVAAAYSFSFCSPRQRERKIHTHAYRAPSQSHTVKINSTLLLFPRRVIVRVCVCVSVLYRYIYILLYMYGLEKQHQNLICAKFIDDYVLPVILFRCV